MVLWGRKTPQECGTGDGLGGLVGQQRQAWREFLGGLGVEVRSGERVRRRLPSPQHLAGLVGEWVGGWVGGLVVKPLGCIWGGLRLRVAFPFIWVTAAKGAKGHSSGWLTEGIMLCLALLLRVLSVS